MKLSIILLYAAVLGAQTYQIGSATDHCTGGLAYPSPQLRYGTFSCVFPVNGRGFYAVQLTFIDPSISVRSTSLTTGRIFSVSINGSQPSVLQNVDLIAAGATMGQPYSVSVDPIISADGFIRVQLTTAVRSAVLSSVTITPSATAGTLTTTSTPPPPPPVTAIDKIAGPVTPAGTSPWPWYEYAEAGNASEIAGTALQFKPQLGAKAAGTFELKDGCNITLTGPGASEFTTGGDSAVLQWDTVDGPGQGRFWFGIRNVQGNVITSQQDCGLPQGIPAGTGYNLYHCGQSCNGDSGSPVTMGFGWWYPWGQGSPWNYYDVGAALYLHAKRTGLAADMTQWRDFEDTDWQWRLDSGAQLINPARNGSLLGHFLRALDGKPQRLTPLYNMLHTWKVFITPSMLGGGFEARESGYTAFYMALGAQADPDPVHHAWYCDTVTQFATELVSSQKPQGYWSEKLGSYPYRPPGAAPWRQFAVYRFLAHGYDVLLDSSAQGCNKPQLAGSVLAALLKAGDFTWATRASNRGTYYDVFFENEGQQQTDGAGTVSVAHDSKSVTGKGTDFTKTFKLGQYLGVKHNDGATWSYKVTAIADATHLTIATPFSDGGDGFSPPGDVADESFVVTDPALSNCNGLVPFCWDVQGNSADGSVAGNRDTPKEVVWINGWLYRTTRDPKWKAHGDEFASSSYGGPAAGPGTSGPCGGPGCDGVETDFAAALHGCASDPKTPCNAGTNYAPPGFYSNTTVMLGKKFGQGAGIGGFDNYLAWRLLPLLSQ